MGVGSLRPLRRSSRGPLFGGCPTPIGHYPSQ